MNRQEMTINISKKESIFRSGVTESTKPFATKTTHQVVQSMGNISALNALKKFRTKKDQAK